MRARSAPVPLLALSLTTLAVAGCLGSAPQGVVDPSGADAAAEVLAGPDARAGELGRWYRYEMEAAWTEPLRFVAVVAESEVDGGGGTVLLATDDEIWSAWEAVYDILPLGTYSLAPLATEQEGPGAFPFVPFPVADGDTWTGVRVVAGEEVELSWEAHRVDAVPAPGGDAPGFMFHVLLPEGGELYRYTYAPSVGWVTQVIAFDPAAPGEVELWRYTMVEDGVGHDGPLLVGTADDITHLTFGIDIDPASPRADPQVLSSFGVGADADTLEIYLWTLADHGLAQVTLRDPSGGLHEAQAFGPPGGKGDFRWSTYTGPAIRGTWEVVTAAAGAHVSGGVDGWRVQHVDLAA